MARAIAPGGPWDLARPKAPDTTPLLGKLAKYVPAEALAPFLPFAAIIDDRPELLWFTWGVCLAVGLLLIAVQVNAGGVWPRVWYWPMVLVAFGVWSVGASEPFRIMLDGAVGYDLDAAVGAYAIGLASVALPLVDSGLDSLFPRDH